jgi:hypothetical protein
MDRMHARLLCIVRTELFSISQNVIFIILTFSKRLFLIFWNASMYRCSLARQIYLDNHQPLSICIINKFFSQRNSPGREHNNPPSLYFI